MPLGRFFACILLLLLPTHACILYRLDQSTKDWWICSDCVSEEQCCKVLVEQRVARETCDALLSSIPTKDGMFSLYTDRSRPLPQVHGMPQLPSLVWETRNEMNAWEFTTFSPFRGDSPKVHTVESTVSRAGGMHRSWQHIIHSVEPQSSIFLFLFLTEHVYMDVEDMLESIKGGSLIHIHTSETISIESPSFDSPQHVVVLELKVNDEESEIRLTTKLHLRYLEPSMSSERSMQLQIPHPVLWNGRGATPHPIILPHVTTGSAGDARIVTGVSILSSLVGASLLLLDLWRLSRHSSET
ncbi:hypothetical protein MHU86_1263 [Fragilaria crotonensis]|nr:hypothetical protein MHU86_1263 [Fragilaria crotonensis]